MQRIHFTTADLARTRLQTTLGPVAEGVFALGVLAGSGNADYARWRAEVRGRLSPNASAVLPSARRMRVCSAPDDLLFLLERARPARRPGPFTSSADASRIALEVWRSGVDPYWARIQEKLQSECEARGRIALAGGVEQLLATLHPKIVWRAPVLEIHDGPDRDIRLDGRGLLLCPSVFLPGRVGRVVENERRSGMAALVLAAPAGTMRAADLWGSPANSAQALSALVGQTRAAALRALTTACTTGQLAARLGISSAGASQHAAILRQSGLITTRRMRNTVLHVVTPLGLALLGGRLRETKPAADLVRRSAAG
ncbi:ArsR/SmtB family transcription factor [Streptomyces ovatisporus]|uniref:ArsR/SmtB family transcription factor n=1 Tax=Streptomyces ovatisporus TaxID=1128682 RepID=A0ABV9A145_9ACTN